VEWLRLDSNQFASACTRQYFGWGLTGFFTSTQPIGKFMKHFAPAFIFFSALLSAAAFAQSRGEADYQEQCTRQSLQGTSAEQAATRKRCIEDAKKAAAADVPGAANQPGTSATTGTPKATRDAARQARRATGAEVARQPKQDPKNPTQ